MKNKIRSNLKATAFDAINFMVIANFIALNNTNAATTTYILSRTTTTTDFKLLLINLLRWLLSVIGNIALIMFIIGGRRYYVYDISGRSAKSFLCKKNCPNDFCRTYACAIVIFNP